MREQCQCMRLSHALSSTIALINQDKLHEYKFLEADWQNKNKCVEIVLLFHVV